MVTLINLLYVPSLLYVFIVIFCHTITYIMESIVGLINILIYYKNVPRNR